MSKMDTLRDIGFNHRGWFVGGSTRSACRWAWLHIQTLEDDKDQLQADKEQLEAEKTALESENLRLESFLEESDETHNFLSENQAEVIKENSALKEQVKTLQAHNESLWTKLHQNETLGKSERDTFHGLRKERDRWKSQAENVARELEEACEDRMALNNQLYDACCRETQEKAARMLAEEALAEEKAKVDALEAQIKASAPSELEQMLVGNLEVLVASRNQSLGVFELGTFPAQPLKK